jgi:DNA adenine methylase
MLLYYGIADRRCSDMPQTNSPFRYPGGKTQLYDFVLNLINTNNTKHTYCEPFAGGAGLPMKLLINNDVDSVWINDFDKSIYSVWKNIIDHPNALIKRINRVPFDIHGSKHSDEYNIEFWKEQRQIYFEKKNYQNSIDNAFATLFLNRTNTSGIITGGPIGGISQKNTKIYVRFNKKTLIDKINLIHSLSERIKLTCKDALELIPLMKESLNPENDFIFFDPPYFEQGAHLYYSSFDENGHRDLAKEILSLDEHKWITTYDKNPQINEMYSTAKNRFEYKLNYSANNFNRGKRPEFMFASPTLKIESHKPVFLTNIN